MSLSVILTGMPEEKDVAQKVFPGVLVLTGTDKLNLPTLVPANCTRLICFGLCGGLAPGFKVGDVVVATSLVDKAGLKQIPDLAWNNKVIAAAASGGATVKPCFYYSSGILDEADTIPERAAMFTKYGAQIIDDESRYVAAEAARRNIAFNIFRSVSDDYQETIPLAATGAIMNANGSANISYLLASLAKDPLQIPLLFRIAKDFKTSLDTLTSTATAVSGLFVS